MKGTIRKGYTDANQTADCAFDAIRQSERYSGHFAIRITSINGRKYKRPFWIALGWLVPKRGVIGSEVTP